LIRALNPLFDEYLKLAMQGTLSTAGESSKVEAGTNELHCGKVTTKAITFGKIS